MKRKVLIFLTLVLALGLGVLVGRYGLRWQFDREALAQEEKTVDWLLLEDPCGAPFTLEALSRVFSAEEIDLLSTQEEVGWTEEAQWVAEKLAKMNKLLLDTLCKYNDGVIGITEVRNAMDTIDTLWYEAIFHMPRIFGVYLYYWCMWFKGLWDSIQTAWETANLPQEDKAKLMPDLIRVLCKKKNLEGRLPKPIKPEGG
ncbi:hypothetical protein KAX17_14790 [Candidatus Bipolaricaulota bacterium]|nr:hypothetical protein [Candidatus Bipolaricaulota bacterium]